MFRFILYLWFLALLSMVSSSQVRVIKPIKTYPTTTDLSFGLGITNSVLFLERNTKENNNALGILASLVYGSSKTFRISIDYTHYGMIDIAPTWYNVKANTLEANLHIMFRSKGNLYLYPLAGVSYNIFSGYFTGKDDFLNLSSQYTKNETVVTRWLGLNAGIGLEYSLKPIIIFGSCKMRVGFAEGHSDLNILDVCYSAGIRYRIVVPSIHRIFRGTHNRYSLDKRKGL